MQLRVARLCLDCEELHTGSRCPRCASTSCAYLTNWLPCEERRRFRGSRAPVPQRVGRFRTFVQSIARRLRGQATRRALTTRRTDAVPELLTLDERPARHVVEPQQSSNDPI